jgi:hypothetical protein
LRTAVDDADYQVAIPLHRHDQQGGFQTRTVAVAARGQQAAQDMKNNADK